MECCRVAVGGIVREREPSRGEKQIGIFVADDGGAHPWDRAVFFVGEQASIAECQDDVASRGNRRWERDEYVEWIHGVAAKSQRFAVGRLYVADNEIRMELDANVAGNVAGSEIDFRHGADGLVNGVKRSGDIVVLGEKARGPRSLGAERRSGAGERDEEQCSEFTRNF